MQEYPVIDSASSVDQLRLRLKDSELEQYGEPFIPEYVYEAIKRLPRFSSMRVSLTNSRAFFLVMEVTDMMLASARTAARCRGIPWPPLRSLASRVSESDGRDRH